ncbi:hypothetical protein EYF80_044351 [Liparis tanakae]|uniref:Uncharacterized protein n=1 Tax=Liparis tanakae TaxID=230148 RepID=A0A4Z2FW32_9TELE|nr:hypothetical protein EYF80_044351 [Liparis tanakae]
MEASGPELISRGYWWLPGKGEGKTKEQVPRLPSLRGERRAQSTDLRVDFPRSIRHFLASACGNTERAQEESFKEAEDLLKPSRRYASRSLKGLAATFAPSFASKHS